MGADQPARARITVAERTSGRLFAPLVPYVQLTKPRIIELLLITTVPAMVVAAGGLPDLGLVVAVVVGGTLAAGSANTLNCYLERDIDAMMARTAHRPLVRGIIPARNALLFGLAIGVAGEAGLVHHADGLALDERAQALGIRGGQEVAQKGLLQHCDNQEDVVRAIGARFEDLIGIRDEVLT